MRWGMVVGGALILSLGVNIYLLMFDSIASTGSTRRPTRQASRPQRPENAPRLPVPDRVARLDRAALEARLATAEAKLEKTLPLSLKFGRAEASAESEARFQPLLDKIFDGAEYTLECRDQICRISSDSTDDWRSALQSDPDAQGMFTGGDFGGDVFVVLQDGPRAAAIRTVVSPLYALRASPALTECKRNNPATGTLWLSVKIEARRFVVSARGPLADHAVGVCVRRALEDIAAATRIPSDVTATEEIPFPVEVP
jgi:hypothetical protein